jgi:hypothetical protein
MLKQIAPKYYFQGTIIGQFDEFIFQWWEFNIGDLQRDLESVSSLYRCCQMSRSVLQIFYQDMF